VAWILKLVKIGVEGEGPCTDIMEIKKPDVCIPMKPPGYTDLKPPVVPISKRPPFQSQTARDGVVSWAAFVMSRGRNPGQAIAASVFALAASHARSLAVARSRRGL